VIQGPGQLIFKPRQPRLGQAPHPFGGQKVLPGGQPLPPEMGLTAVPHPGQMNESTL